MEEQAIVRRFRWFWVWQDEAEEQWLSRMALEEGLHLVSVRFPGLYTFVRGPRRRDVYRLDYRSVSSKEWGDYVRDLQDEGWEYLGQMNGWQYYRQENVPGEPPELYADPKAKAEKYRRIMVLYVVLLPAWFIVLRSSIWQGPPVLLREILRFVVFVLMLLWIYALLRIMRRASEIKGKEK